MTDGNDKRVENFGERVKLLRLRRGLNQSELADLLGVSGKAVISRIELGQTELTGSKIVALAEALGTSPQFLMGWTGSTSPILSDSGGNCDGRITVPVLKDFINAYADGKERVEDRIIFPDSILDESREYFAMIMPDDSMSGAGIAAGDLLIFAFSRKAENGDIVCAGDGISSAVCRKYFAQDGKAFLLADDSRTPLAVFSSPEDISMSGILAYSIKKHKK